MTCRSTILHYSFRARVSSTGFFLPVNLRLLTMIMNIQKSQHLTQAIYERNPRFMNLRSYLKSKRLTIRGFARDHKISHYSVQKYVQGTKPAPRQAWKIFNVTNGEVSFQDMGYSSPPKNSLKDI